MIDTNGGETQKLTPEEITKMEEETERHELHSAIGKVVDFCKNHDVSVIITKSDHFIYSGDYDVLGEFIKKLEGTKGDINMKIKGYRILRYLFFKLTKVIFTI